MPQRQSEMTEWHERWRPEAGRKDSLITLFIHFLLAVVLRGGPIVAAAFFVVVVVGLLLAK